MKRSFNIMSKLRPILLVLTVGIIFTIILTWPFAKNLTSYFTDQGDYPLNGAIFWYNQDSITSGRIFNQKEYFRGYQFYPHPFSLAFGNNAVVPALIFAPIYWFTQNLSFSVNILTFLTFVLSFISSYFFIRYFLRLADPAASLIGAFIFTFNPQTMVRFPQHLDILNKYFLPMVFLFAYQFLEKPSLKRGFWFGLFFTLNGLSVTYYFIFTLVMLPILAVSFFLKQLVKKNWIYFFNIARFGAVVLVFLPLILYFYLPYLEFIQKEGVERRLEETIFFSSRITDWFTATPDNLFYGSWVRSIDHLRDPKDDRGILNYEEHTLFVGLLPLILFFVGLKIFIKQKINKTYFYLLLVLPFIFTFGPYFNGRESSFKLPFYFLYEWFPFFKGIRSPTRFEFLFYIPFALIVSYGVAWLCKKWQKYSLVITGILLALLVLENFTVKNYDSRSTILSKVNQIGRENLQFLQGKAVLHLPIYTTEDADEFGKGSAYLNWLTQTRERIVNGNSAYLPPDHLFFLATLKQKFDDQALLKLKALGVNYLVIHQDLLGSKGVFKQGVILDTADTTIIDISNYNLLVKTCTFDRDISVRLGKVQGEEESFALVLKNQGDCFLTSPFEERYRTIDIEVDGVKKKAHLRLPILIEPGQEVILKI